MAGDIKKLIESVQADIILMDMLHQWANTPTGVTAAVKNRWIPNHELIMKNLIARYNNLDKENAKSYFEKFKILVEEAGFDFNVGYLDVVKPVNEYLILNPILKNQTLFRLAAAKSREGQIAWLYSKIKDKRYPWNNSYSEENYENNEKTFKKFGDIFATMFDGEHAPSRHEIIGTLINLGFMNELDSITSKTHKETGEFVFSSYLEDIAKNIDKYVNVNGPI